MKIIKPGKLPGKHELEGKCPHCKTEVEARHFECDKAGAVRIITCPTYGCGNIIIMRPKGSTPGCNLPSERG